jgi:HD-GYP domain-containing protein (c-di-GMP phosphodiesterase class II)
MSSEPRFRIRPRLLWTLLAALVLVGVLPLVVSNYFLIGINRDSLETLEKKYLTRSAVGISSEIQSLVASYTQPFAHAADANLMSSYTSADPDLLALRIVNASGVGSSAQPERLGPDVTQELNNGVQLALQGQTYIGSFQYVSSLNQPAIVIAVPVGDRESGVSGAVEALVSLRRISERVRDEAKGDVTAFIVDRTGHVLIHSEPAIGVRRPDLSNVRIVQEFKKAPVRLTESYTDPSNNGREMLGTVAPVGSPDWGVVVQKEQSRAFASVDKMVRRTIEWSGVAVILALIIGSLFATRITRPIRALVRRTHEIAAGDYKQRVEVKTSNEIGDLADNFNVMSGAIEKSMDQLKKAAHENQLLFVNSVRMLAAAIDAKDPYTRGHSERVARYSVAIGKHLQLGQEEMRNLRISALLHDVGKIGIDDRILRKPGALSDDEFEVMKGHPEKGAAIMSGVAQLIDIIPGMKYHHEKWAGGGYPDGLKAEEIPMQARIVAIADTFDAMTTNRPYQKAMETQYVVDKIVSFGGTRFDPVVVDAFVRAVKAGDIQPEEQIRGAA